ncbi:MAG TPA: non-ribosomal peptide synthase/polyketide synthase, partial [Longimicrobiaceae bacterium]
ETAFYPCYGLAEATLMVTGSRPAEPAVERAVDPEALGGGVVRADDADGRYRLVGSGRSAPSQRVIVVDPATLRECPADRVGEVWVSGPSVARGYWGRAEETAETFGGYEAGSGEGPFLRTGDLGFLDGGELFVTGRLKDLIVIRGRNHYPQDVEQTALRSHEGLRAGSGAAFSVDRDGEERLVVVQEVSRQAAAGVDVEEVAGAIRRAVASEHGLQVHAVAVVRPGGVPKTTSGKVQRRECRARFLAGDLPLVGVSVREEAEGVRRSDPAGITREVLEAAAAGERQALLEDLLVERVAQVLGVDPAGVDREQPLVALGLDSLRAMELKGALETSLGVPVPVSSLLDDTRIERLAADLLQEVFLAEAAEPGAVAEGEAPLSFAQERLWFLDRLMPGSAAYNLAGAIRLRGEVDAATLRRSLEEIVRRHETLRTVFAEVEGRPVQRVLPAGAVPLPAVDLSRLDPGTREGAARRAAEAAARAPFALEAGPPFRARLLRLGADEHLLVLVLHHIVGDGWSGGVLMREVGALYPALLAGEPSPLPPLPTQYADWALRQRDGLRGDVVEEQLAYWRERLAGLAALDLPTDHPRPAVQSFRGATHRFEVPAAVMDGVRSLARGEGATLFMTLLAAWDLLLSRYSGEGDVAVGTAVSSRDRAGVAGLVGLFVDTLVLRVEVVPEEGFRALLARARAAALEAFDRRDLPFERLVEEVQPERDLSRNPLFQVMLAPQSAPPEPVELPGATLVPEPLDGGAAILDLTLYTWERSDGGLDAGLEYAADLFEAGTARRMAAHLVQVLRAVAADPDRAVAELPLLLPAERAQLLEEWTATGRACPERSLHELFAEQAARTPDAAALRFEGRPTSYAELDRSANRLAHHLRALGVGPEVRVGLCVERTPEMVAAMLGVLKAGGAYVPLDPTYPAGRLEYMLEDAGAAVVVSQAHLAERLPPGVPRLLLDAEAESIAARPDTAPEGAAEPGNLAYVLYTSGSTGRPKGVQVEHRSASQVVHFLRDGVRPEARAAVRGSTSVSYDVSVGEIFGTICWGGTLVLVESVLELPRVADEGVRLVVTVPSAVAELLRAGGIPESVRAFDLAGEALPAALARELYALPGTERVLNLYGPTEDTVYSTWSEVERGAERVRIGRPVPGSWAYVLDPAGNPAPVGVAGELCLGGAGTARGYHGRPDLTAERFVPDPFAPEPGARVYRTGDLVRWIARGELEYLGRADQQVKVRGFRIEPAEVESALLGHPAVRHAVIVARDGRAGGKRLVAYVVPAEGASPSAEELRVWLRLVLPEHMVPSAFVALETLPLTPSGKTDRRALPEPEQDAAAFVAPRTGTEEVLSGIWAEVLGVERVGVEESFFDLGGHSLLAMQVVSRVRQAFGVEVPLRSLFQAPTVAALAARVEALHGAGSPAAPPVVAVSREVPLPLSFAQQRLWLVDRLEPGSAAYNMAGALRLRGPLGTGALRAGLDALTERHETLRTTFAERDGTPVQVIGEPAPVALPVLDLRGVADPLREAERLAGEEALRPFDLAHGPLLRATLLRLAEDDHVLCFTLHHIVADGWSLRVLVRELSVLYAGARLPELPVQYADYAVWQRAWLSGEALEAQLAWWRERLDGAPPLLDVPTDRPRTAGLDARAGSHRFALAPETTRALRALGRREGATLFMTLLAGWQALLDRWAGQEDVVVGSPVAGRTRRETEGVVGFFVNLLALRADLSGDPTWAELVGRTREAALGAYAHQDLPFERLVETLGVERSLTHTPLFQATFALERSAAHDGLLLGEVAVEPFGTEARVAKFDLELTLSEEDEGLRGELLFRRALFDAETARRMAGHLGTVLEAMAAAPGERCSALSLLRGAEREQVLEAWNATAADVPEACVHDLFVAQAARTPEAVAVAWGGATLGYGELERRSGALARRLRARGVGPETRVGVCLERGPALLVGLLGVLRAGGAYVPLDPSYPRERLAYMLDDARVPVLLTEAGLASTLPEHRAETVLLDGADADGEGPLPDQAADPRNAAYVIYTSGSTGRPKGVVVEHAAVVNLLAAMQRLLSPGPADVLLAVTPLSFDISALELFLPLTVGATVALADAATASDGARLRDALVEIRPSVMQATPATWQMLLEAGWEATPGLTILCGGEALAPGLAARLRRRGAALWNVYGPTETTIWSTAARIDHDGGVVTVGRPLGNTRVYLLDRHGLPVPAGVPGAMYIGGSGVARGYLDRPELTAGRFVPDAFGAEAGGRLYDTGDRARFLADGRIEHLGRADEQVKVRGFRIEPGEVEGALLAHPGVQRAVVVARDDRAGGKRLVAYVVPAEGAPPSAGELRAWLRGTLPEHMVPSAVVSLETLPLTPSGKVDRRALPEPGDAGAAEPVAPSTPTEEILAGIWASVLGTERVGAHDDFFALGGHSLLGTRVVARLRDAFGVELPLRALFEAPTVAALAGRVEAALGTERPTAARIPRRAGDGPAPLSFAQQRLWFIHQLDPRGSTYNMPFALRLRGAPDVRALRRSIAGVVRRHEAVRTVFVDRGGEPVQVVLPHVRVPFAVLDLAGLPGESRGAEAARRVAEEAQLPFDLARGPLLRVLLVRLAEEEWTLCFTMHHVVSDGWSMGVLVREVSALYAGSPLPELELQYADFAAWQRERLTGEVLEAQLRYWREKLEGAPAVLELPTDHPRRSALGATETGRPFALSAGTTQGLRALGRRESATLFMTLMAGWQTLLWRWSGQDDLVVGTAVANRTRAELEGLIGFFVNSLALRGDLSGDPGFRGLLGRVRETALGAYAHQDLPFEKLVEELAPERSVTHNPLFQVMFALQNMEVGRLDLGELEMEPLGAGDAGAKFDLRVTLTEVGERIEGQLIYRADLFEGATIERMAEHFRLLLESAVADPGRRVGTLPLLTAAERERVVARWSGTEAAAPPGGCVHERFAAQAARTPDAPAVTFGGEALSYAELDRRANRLAHALVDLGVGPEVAVALCLERSAEMVVAVLGVLKAGGAYVPLDPAYPAERLAYTLADCGAPVLVTLERHLDALPGSGARVLSLDGDAALLDAQPDHPPAVDVDPRSLAYVIYTSGSTGRPKGVLVPHGQVARLFAVTEAWFGFDERDVWTLFHSYAFDFSVWEIWGALLHGGRLVVVPLETARDPDAFRALLERERVTVLNQTPSAFRQLAAADERVEDGAGLALRYVVFGGEALEPASLRPWTRRHGYGRPRLVNMYGITETTVHVTCRPLGPGEVEGGAPSLVGGPLPDLRVYVLSAAGEPAPIGVPGEMYVGGAGVARGYLGRPELTAERFVPDGLSGEPGARLYRSGDRARWTAHGELEYLGRVDQQVKIRGFRIEPGEVEAVLAEHPGVREAAVTVREDVPGDPRLVAYVVPGREPAGAPGTELQAGVVQEWESVFGTTYSVEAADGDPAFNVVGWNSSYTGEPIPAGEMREWVEDTVGRLRALRPRRVLEIGCGTGLLLFRLAPECEEYWGCDLSPAAISYLEAQLARPGRELPGVRLLRRPADDFAGIPGGRFDLVVVNSVVQYLPGLEYLLKVVDGAVAALAPGGKLWLGDLRSLPLQEAFHASVELAQAGDAVSAPALRERTRMRTLRDEELLLDPDFFRALPRRLPRISGVEMRLKHGRHANEMTRFRYDVLLHVEAEVPRAAPRWRRWDEPGGLDAVCRVLDDEAPEALAVSGVPNPRVAGALAVLEALGGDAEPGSVAELRALAAEREARAPDPEAFRELAEARGYRTQARPSARGGPGEYDVLLARGAAALLEEAAEPLPWSTYASDPLASRRSRRLLAELRAWLGERLPEHMVPGALVVLETLPLTPSGKVDRRALPAPEAMVSDGGYQAPRTAVEEVLGGIWATVLGVERVGVEDGFFDLGGHSLLATQVVSRARQAFGVEVPLRMLFEAPTLGALAGRIGELLSTGTPLAPPIERVPREGPLPLSFAQQRLWVVDRIDPGSSTYNMPAALRMRGELNPGALRASLRELVRRHEALRTVFRERGGVPVQVIGPPARVPLPTVELGRLPAGVREREAERLARAEALRPFDLACGPLLRSTLLRLGESDQVLCFTLHHVVGDGWSVDVLVREVTTLYAAFRRGEPSPLPELPVQYADYAVWQRSWLSGEVLEAQLDFWRTRLAGAPPLLEIPIDRPRSAPPGARGGTHRFALPAAVTQGLWELSRRGGATLFMTVLAGWQALLSKYSGQEDVVVGSPVAGRSRREVEGLIGFFVNMLPLRTDLGGDPSWEDLLARVREGALGAYGHQDVPFEQLVEELVTDRSLTHAPLFQVVFALERALPRDERLSLGGMELEPFETGRGVVRFDLNLTLTDEGGALGGRLVYREALFDAATVERMARHLETLLKGMVAEPGRRLSESPLLRAEERERLLCSWNGADTGYAGDRCLHELVHAQVQRTPGAPALRFEGESLSYEALFLRACRLAHLLRERGIGPERRVAICMEPAPEMIVSVLGVLLAGGAYLPVDPDLPSERRDFVIGDGGPVLLLTQTALAGRLADCGVPVLCVDAGAERIGRRSAAVPASGVDPRNLAYVIYTSGSTGLPKGVAVEHAGVGNTVLELGRVYDSRPGDRHLLFAPLHFDSSAGDIFLALCSGATLVVARRDAMLPGAEGLLRVLREERITHMKTTSSALAALPWGPLPELRSIVTGGEVCTAELIRTWGQERSFFNGYGATEASIRTTSTRYTDTDRDPPIGHPAPNTRLYVLDGVLEPVPFGVAGEIYIGGAGVVRGYLNRPELTAERFLPDPHRGIAGARLYRTGDKGRRRPDGEVEFLGRVDFQVKVRGYRVEPGEIEAALRAHSAVREAVVLLRGDAGHDPRLVAYVVPEEGARVATPELRELLGTRLPEYMVPGAYVVLEQFPLNPNGTLDRRALPAPRWEGAEAYEAPSTATQELLCGIWAEVLGSERVGTRDSFFELGGHSLLATQVAARARRVFGVEMPLRALFEAPTVAGLAERVEALRHAGAPDAAPPLERASRGRPPPLSFAQRRLWVVDRLEPGSAAYNMPYALRLRGALDPAVLRRSLDALVRRHEALRTVFAEEDGVPVQVVRDAAPVGVGTVDLRRLPAEAREGAARRLAGEEALRPFDLARGPLLRSTLLRLGEREHLLCFTLHHIVSDGWSTGVLVREVAALYGALARGEAPELPELPVQYADYAVWQRGWLRGEVLEAQLAWWKERMAGAPPLLEIPTDRPRGAGQDARAERHAFALGVELTRRLRELGRREGATLFMTMLAGWQALLGRYAGEDDLVVGTPVAGRSRVEVEGLIGFFVNLLPLRVELRGDPTWGTLLGRVREEALGAYAHQDLPFERLVDEVVDERTLAHAPLVQVAYSLARAVEVERVSLGGVELETVGVVEEAAKFDLYLSLVDTGDTLDGALLYRKALFEPATIARMAGHLEVLLEAMTADPARRLSAASLLRGAERARVLEGWNPAPTEIPHAAVHELFAQQAARAPDAVAVVFRDQSLTYDELDRRANRLAHHLLRLGVVPEEGVGVCMERGPELVVGVLGVLKAGAAYVPLDPSHPGERLREILADAGVTVVLTAAGAGAHLPAGAVVVRLDAPGTTAALAAMSPDAPSTLTDPRQLAYVVYTSGSTGRPKGVAVPHRAVVRLVRGTRYVAFGPGERIAHASNPAFDAATFEIWGALLNGGCVVVVGRDAALAPAELAAELRERRVSTLFLTTALFNRISHDAPDAFSTLRHLLFGGEAVDPESVRRVLESGAPERLLHVYGPTETTTFAAWHRVRRVEAGAATVPIGAAVGNTTLYVLDGGGEAAPAGIAGELYVGGPGVARGYLGRADLTAERFVPDACSGEAGARLYRTGDRVRWNGRGEVEFLGRADAQVKIRGFRIEPGEVEAVLLEQERVREATVVVREDGGEKRLVAYVVGDAGTSAAELREELRRRLPEYMVPAAIVPLEALPLTPHGKVDRRALPAPRWGGDAAAYAGPTTVVESLLCRIWTEMLGVERVGVADNFFDLGGDSILAIQVVSRARRHGLKVAPRQLFERPTIARLAEVVEPVGAGIAAAEGPVAGRAPLTPIQHWFLAREQAAPHHFNQALLLTPREALDPLRLDGAMAALEAHHDALRLRFGRGEEGAWTPVHAGTGDRTPPGVLDLAHLPGEERRRALETAAGQVQRSLELARGPLLRAALFDLGGGGQRLLLVVHHLVVDGVSWRILLEDLEAAYAQLARGEAVRLPAKTTSWRAWAERLAEHARSAPVAEEAAYWTAQAAKEVAPLPVDDAGGENTVAEARAVTVR